MTTILTHGADLSQGDPLPAGVTVLSDGTYLVKVLIPTEGAAGPYNAVWLQRYTVDGVELGDPVNLDAYEQYDALRIIPLAEGYVVADRMQYEGNPGGTYYADFFQVFSADGHAVSYKTQLTSYKTSAPNITVLDTGDIVFSWRYGSIGNVSIYHPGGALVSHQTFRSLNEPEVIAAFGGHFGVSWFGIDGRSHSELYDGLGQPVVGDYRALGDTLTHGLEGSIFMTWQANDPVSNKPVLVAGAFDASGHATSEVTRLAQIDGAPQTKAVRLSDGGFVVAWRQGDGSAAGDGVYVGRFDSAGHLLGFPVLVNAPHATGLTLFSVLARADTGFTVNWQGVFAEDAHYFHTTFSPAGDLSLDNLLFGTSGGDVLNGGGGADIMGGGVGNDTYYVDNVGDQVQELAGAGTDWVYSLITYTLPTDVEILTLRGTTDIDGYGNALNNRLAGNAGANHLYGGAGNDDLRALAGNDTLNGNSGADTLYGGPGDDLYYVDNAGDRAFETAAGDGVDTVRASVDFALGAYVENLALVGTDNLRGFGNELANTLTGNAGANILRGLDGNDRIDGGAGADSLIGGTGNDTYYVDSAGDKVYESSGEGIDRVYSSVSFAIDSQAIESVTLTGSININAAGGAAADQLTGNGGANILTGNAGNDSLNGGGGSDTLNGGLGSDVFAFSLASGTDTISDFLSSDNDHIDLHAYSLGVVNGGGIMVAQVGADTTIDLGGGNVVVVLQSTAGDVNSHIIW